MSEVNFFKQQTVSSRIKATIVSQYFPDYARIILKKPQAQIRFLDLFSGPGVYADGSPSTPMLVGEACANDPILRQKVRLMFNDNEHIETLKANFLAKFPLGTFKYEPRFGSETVGASEKINEFICRQYATEKNPYPTLMFFDPFGYKGIDTASLGKFLKNWGNEIFLFLNTKRVNAALENSKFEDLMRSMFPTKMDKLKTDRRWKASVNERIHMIIETMHRELVDVVGESLYYCPFRFIEEDSSGTSHYILHFCKHPRGFELVKQIYYDYDNIGSELINGVYTFDAKKLGDMDSALDFGDMNVETLVRLIVKEYRGSKLTARALFDEHHIGKNFALPHYTKALRYLVENNLANAYFTDQISHRVSVLINEYCVIQIK